MWLNEMSQLVHDHVVRQPHRELQQSPVEEDHTASTTGTPAKAQVPHFNLGWSATGLSCEHSYSLFEPLFSHTDIPAPEVVAGARPHVAP
jgi:hypothetical protein